jgi:hypothetical protein
LCASFAVVNIVLAIALMVLPWLLGSVELLWHTV